MYRNSFWVRHHGKNGNFFTRLSNRSYWELFLSHNTLCLFPLCFGQCSLPEKITNVPTV